MEEVRVGLFGLGTVGTGVVRLLERNREIISRRLGAALVLRRIVDTDLTRDRELTLPAGMLTDRAEAVLDDPDVGVVVELIGGTGAARDVVLRALDAGKHVVTANKALLALHGEELFARARERGLKIAFEASVGGGIPVLRALREGLAANRIRSIYGIVNGTANYILTQMTRGGRDFETVLAEARARGYAEADPTYDVEGIDSAHKAAIMASLAFGTPVPLEEVYTEGISGIRPLDIEYAAGFGYKIKLLAITKEDRGEVEVRVHPTMIPERTLLARVDGVLNAIYVHGDAVGPTLYYGRGAGALPTASAVVGDLIEVARDLLHGGAARVPPQGFQAEARRRLRIRPMEDVRSRYFLRFTTADRPGVLSHISGILADHGISIASVIQKGRRADGPVPIVMMTHEARERDVTAALERIDALDVVASATVRIRVEEGDSAGAEDGEAG